jgi:inorganic triphosphatase YgiF
MEIEMKYAIADKATAEAIWEDAYLSEIGEVDSRETLFMKSAYFDTESRILSAHDVAFRVRMEGNRVVASLKWNGESENGLHRREEVNVPVVDPACFIKPSPEIFKESETGREMIELIGRDSLESMLEIRYLRRRMRIDNGRSILEVAIDTGSILTDFGELPICELEIELFSGEEEDVVTIGIEFAKRFQLTPLNESKYARGLKLIAEGIK